MIIPWVHTSISCEYKMTTLLSLACGRCKKTPFPYMHPKKFKYKIKFLEILSLQEYSVIYKPKENKPKLPSMPPLQKGILHSKHIVVSPA